MPFDAAESVAELEYDFDSLYRKYPEQYPALQGVKGVTPEPSDDDMEAFRETQADAMRKVVPEGVDPTDMQALAAATRDVDPAEFRKVEDEMAEAVARLTKGKPSLEQINALPFRVKRRYIQSLQQELMNPESGAVATRP